MTRRLGQHFLQNKTVVKKIIDAIAPEDGDVIIEIGPGHGELTGELLRYPVRVIAIEKDPALVDFLRKKFQITNDKLQINSEPRKENLSEIEIIHGDVLKVLPELIRNRKLEIGNYKLVGNIPYYLTGFLFRTISGLSMLPKRAVFMIQKEVALRATATPPHMNLLAASIQLWAKPKVVMIVGKNDFAPKPKVDSAVILLETHQPVETPSKQQGYFDTLHALFGQPRKTIVNNITLAFRSLKKCNKAEKDGVAERLKQIGVKPNDRPHNLCVEDIKKIGEMLYNYDG